MFTACLFFIFKELDFLKNFAVESEGLLRSVKTNKLNYKEMFVKVSRKGIFLALMYGMLTPGLALGMAGIPNEYGDDSKYDHGPTAEEAYAHDWGYEYGKDPDYQDPVSKPGADAGVDRYDGVAGYDASLDAAQAGGGDRYDDSGSSDDSPMPSRPAKKVAANPFGHTSPATLESEVQHFLRYTERQDTSGHKSDHDDYDSSNVEGIQHTIAREVQECIQHISLLEEQINKLKGFEAASDPVKAFNDSRGWKLWKKKATSLQDIQNDREVEEKQLTIAEQHLNLMLQYAGQLAGIEGESYQKQIRAMNSILDQNKAGKMTVKQAVDEYNKQFGWYQYFSKVSTIDAIKKQKEKLQKEVDYWHNYTMQLHKILPERIQQIHQDQIAQNWQHMSKHGVGVGVASPKVHVSPTPFMGKKKAPVVHKTPDLPPAPPTRPASPLVTPADSVSKVSATTSASSVSKVSAVSSDAGAQLLRLSKLLPLMHHHIPVAPRATDLQGIRF